MKEGSALSRRAVRRLRRPSLLSAGVAVAVVAAGAAGVAIGVAHPTSPPQRQAPPAVAPPCAPVATASPAAAPHAIGSWRFHLVDKGTFLSVVPTGGGAAVALQACGATESSLRVVRLSGSQATAWSSSLARSAPIASAVAVAGDDVVVGTGRLVLTGDATEPPYRLSLTELEARSLAPRRTLSLGRGYGVELAVGNGEMLVSTGRQLFELTRTGALRLVASFPGVVVQHIAIVRSGTGTGTGSLPLALVSLFTPAAAPPEPATRLALVELADGQLVSSLTLPAGVEVESLAATSSGALVAVNRGGTTRLKLLQLRPGLSLGSIRDGVPATLAQLSLSSSSAASSPSSGPVLAFGSTTFACVSPGTGSVLSSTTPEGIGETTTAATSSGRTTFAVTPAGIGTVTMPSSCW